MKTRELGNLNQLKVSGERTDEQIAGLGKLGTEFYGCSGVHHTKWDYQ